LVVTKKLLLPNFKRTSAASGVKAMAALASVGWCGTVFHTIIARKGRRASSFMISKG
jgi:hypothetical protein